MSATVPAPNPPWLTHLLALAEALETGGPLPDHPAWMKPLGPPKLTLIRGGRDG